jgi:protein TonB
VLFLVALILVPSFRSKNRFPDNPLVVDLVAAPRPAAQAQPAAPAAAPAPTPETARLETREPPKPKPLPENPEPVKKPKKEPEKTPALPPTPPPAAPSETPPDESAEVVSDGSGSITALEGLDSRFAWYQASVQAALFGNWRRPALDGLVDSIDVRVTFEILRDGSVRDVRVSDSSGIPALDRSALRAVADAAPLPPLPTSWRGSGLSTACVFRLHPE